MKKFFAFDTETHLFGPGNKAPRAVCLSVAEDGANTLHVEDEMQRVMLSTLEQDDLFLVGQNTAYDTAVLMERFTSLREPLWKAYDRGLIQCTRVRERLLDIRDGYLKPPTKTKNPYSLETLAFNYLGETLDKANSPRLTYGELDGVSIKDWPQAHVDYALKDARATLLVCVAQEKRASTYEGFSVEAARQARYDFALHLTSCWGMVLDQAHVATLRKTLAHEIATQTAECMKADLIRDNGSLNLTTVRAILDDWFFSIGEEPPQTNTGKTCTDAKTLERCANPALKALVQRNAAAKLMSTYLDTFAEAGENPVHPRYEVLQMTGRTSCSNPNLQNQPRKHSIRECFVPRPGHVFAFCDYDSQELRTLAQVLKEIAGKSSLAERYSEDPNYDPHVDFACAMLGISYSEGLERKKNKDPELKEYRQRAKAANFGFPGGMGLPAFVSYAQGYGIELDVAKADELKQAWLRQQPEMRDYFGCIASETRSGSGLCVQLFSGRQRGNASFSEMANSYFQGLASDASKSALYEVARRCYSVPDSPLFGARPCVFIHDEIGIEVPEDRAPEAAEELARVMTEAMQVWTPDVPSRASATLMRRWSKDAEAVRDVDGRLVPWEPK